MTSANVTVILKTEAANDILNKDDLRWEVQTVTNLIHIKNTIS